MRTLDKLEIKIKADMEEGNFEGADDTWKEARKLIKLLFEEDVIEHWEELEYEYLESKKRQEGQAEILEKLKKLKKKILEDIEGRNVCAADAK